jgi:hypothetical protein
MRFIWYWVLTVGGYISAFILLILTLLSTTVFAQELSVTSNVGPVTGATQIEIVGTDFKTGATVTIGGSPCEVVLVQNSNLIICATPIHTAGAQDVRVENPDGEAVILNDGFIYHTLPAGDTSAPFGLFPIMKLSDADVASLDFDDGSVVDWENILGDPFIEAVDMIPDLEVGEGAGYDPNDLDYRIWLGWHRSTGRLYMAMERTDNIFQIEQPPTKVGGIEGRTESPYTG